MVEFRKLISFGKTSFVTSIPKNWVLKNNLKKGDLIAIEENVGNLVISPKPEETKPQPKEVIVNIDKKEIPYIKREIIQNYINNVNKMIIVGSELKDKAVDIREILHNLVALEIMEQTKDKIITKDFIDMGTISIVDTIKKIDIIIRAMIIDTKVSAKEPIFESIRHRDEDVNRLTFVVFRAIKYALENPSALKNYKLSHNDLLDYWQIGNSLEKLADDSKRIAKVLYETDLDKKYKDKIIDLYSKVEKTYLKVMKSFYKRDKQAAFDISDSTKEMLLESEDLAYKNNTGSNRDMGIIVEKLKQMIMNVHTISRVIYI